jgi:hypothetical protein
MLLNPVKGVPGTSNDWLLWYSGGNLDFAFENKKEYRTRPELGIGQRP